MAGITNLSPKWYNINIQRRYQFITASRDSTGKLRGSSLQMSK
ncbi:18262_t:CDS:1, partial [Gigaspora rosea]